MKLILLIAAFTGLLSVSPARAQGDVDRPAGKIPEFKRYSGALGSADFAWSRETLDRWLEGPEKLVPGTTLRRQGGRLLKSATAQMPIGSPSQQAPPIPFGNSTFGSSLTRVRAAQMKGSRCW